MRKTSLPRKNQTLSSIKNHRAHEKGINRDMKIIAATILINTVTTNVFGFRAACSSRNLLPYANLQTSLHAEDWKGEVVSNTADGRIKGCTIQLVEGSLTEWVVQIDGVEADLGRFSDAIYRKIIQDAKRQRFQGFRPGTIPPHLEPTYRAFTMDECARETIVEALQQNNIRPFESARSDMSFEMFSIPPPNISTNKKKGKRKAEVDEVSHNDLVPWREFATMKEAIDAGWKPGQSFSFVAKNVKGQKVQSNKQSS